MDRRPEKPADAAFLVNRIWQHHFGQGIVRTANNFGAKGDKPTHPELLDWLTAQFLEGGWKSKPLAPHDHAYRMLTSDRRHIPNSKSWLRLILTTSCSLGFLHDG